ncbi:MAG TPA: aminopeptidase [Oligoflexus sp.]|uniref:aminopeptidase n=1 Tax=Oligoflexus sp. TaxID=1971216 RepID=UPI002D339AB8|nr:aminopeptidase [Oligoflexus sp.]HYX38271.1 aminopeptidase [Oligoflexus sp.]
MAGNRWILGLCAWILSSCYSLQQAYWFNNAFNSRMPVTDVLQQSGLPETARRKLQLSRQVLKFADEQGLNVGNAYQHYIPPGPGTVSYLVQAAEADRLALKTWWFPFVGTVPYLGFFNREARDDKAKDLKAEGLDVSLGTVGAFSSLGWFADPIYDAMTKRRDEDYIQLLLHELVHRSFWSKGSAAFNENLAEFASLHLAEVYLKAHRGGAGLAELKNYKAEKEKLSQWIFSLRDALKELYGKPMDRDQKLKDKAAIILSFRRERFPELTNPELAGARDREWNNASILGAALYAPDTKRFQKAFDCLKPDRMGDFLEALQEAEDRTSTVEQALDSLCAIVIEKEGA